MLQSGYALFGEQRRKTKVKSKESGGDEKFLSSEMARNRESVCDHHRNPEPQACTERGSHQETFERKERRDRAVESIRNGRTGVCRCSGELTGAGDERGPGRRKSAWVCGPLSLGETRLAGWSALPVYVSPARWRLPHQSISVSKKLKATVYLHPPRHSPHRNTRL